MNILSIVVSCVSMCGTGCAIFFACKGGKKSDIEEISQRAAESARMNFKLDSIISAVSDIRTDIKAINESLTRHDKKFVEIESDLKSLERRVSKLEEK